MKQWIQHNKRMVLRWTVFLVAAGMICQSVVLAQQCQAIRREVVRLHILANSDSQHDQELKLKVRDRLLTDGNSFLSMATNSEEALGALEENLPRLEALAEDTLQQNGCDLPVTCSLEQTFFNTRIYDTITMPAGNYTALRVIIGEGSGENWWCVMFPPLCIPAATDVTAKEETLEDVLTNGQTDLVENGEKYEVKFKAVEWFQQAVDKCRQWF